MTDDKFFADDTQIHLALRSSDIQNGLALLADCTAAVKQWYLTNGLLLNADKSEAICLGTSSQLRTATDTVTVAGTTLSVSCLLYTSPSPRDRTRSRMPSSA